MESGTTVSTPVPPGRRRSPLSYVGFALAVVGLGAVGLAKRAPFPVEAVLAGAGACFLGCFVCRYLDRRKTLTSHRRPKDAHWGAFGVALSVAGILGSMWILGTRPDPRTATKAGECEEHLRRIVGLYRRKQAGGDLGPRRGALQLVRWMREFAKGEEHVLICPTDLEYPYLAEDRALYHDDLKPDHEVRARVSYVLRDFARFPVEGDAGATWIVCCRQGLGNRKATHGDGLLVGFADGTVRLVRRSELGVPPGEPIHAGVRAEDPQLKAMLYIE